MKHLSRLDIEAIAEKYITAYMELPEVQDIAVYSKPTVRGTSIVPTKKVLRNAEKSSNRQLHTEIKRPSR